MDRVSKTVYLSLSSFMAFLKIRPGDEAGIEERKEDWKAPINKTPLVAAAALHLLLASLQNTLSPVGFPKKKTIPFPQFEGIIQ